MFDLLDGLSHPGVRASQCLIGKRFCGMACEGTLLNGHIPAMPARLTKSTASITHLTSSCLSQQRPVPISILIWWGPLPPSKGFTHMFTMIDRYFRWPEVVPLKSTTAQDCADALILQWVLLFGVLHHLTSDRGPHFTSALWSFLAATLGVTLHHTSPYHLQTNGVVEYFHRGLKASVRACLLYPSWIQQLSWDLISLRLSICQDFWCSSADLLLKFSPLLLPKWISVDHLKLASILSNASNCVVTHSRQVSRPPLYYQGGGVTVVTLCRSLT